MVAAFLVRRFSRWLIFAVTLFGLGFPAQSHAELSWFSRANCLNNESITWDAFWNDYYWLYTYSLHRKYIYFVAWPQNIYAYDYHMVVDPWNYTWRSAAIHWGEGNMLGRTVMGYHYALDYGVGYYYLGTTMATDCNAGEW